MNEEYDWEQHAADKQAARDQDMEDIKTGKVTALELRERNFMFSGLDFSKCVAVSPCGMRFSHAKKD
jgi:hypothetical protein